MQQNSNQPYQQPTQYSSQPYYQPTQYPQYSPPPPYQEQPKKKSKKWLWIALGVIALTTFTCIGTVLMTSGGTSTTSTASTTRSDSSSQDSQPTAQPTKPATFTTTHTFSGNGIEKTEIFSVGDDWKLQWTCDPTSFMGGQYNVQVYVYGSDGSMQDVAINDICKDGNTSGETEEHSGGQIYLDVESEGSWNLTIQEPK